MISERDLRMIDEYNRDGTGWARFSHDRVHRFRLGRIVSTRVLVDGAFGARSWTSDEWRARWTRVVFLLLNPSTADAFAPDNTVSRCVKFAQIWEADVLEVVNLFSFRSTYPEDLPKAINPGDGPENDAQLIAACRGAHRVVAGWGLDGGLHNRAHRVTQMLRAEGIALHCLARTAGGAYPRHPLARGKSFIPYTKELEVF